MPAKPSRRPPAEAKRGAPEARRSAPRAKPAGAKALGGEAKRPKAPKRSGGKPAAMTKAQMTADLAGRANLTKAQVANVITGLTEIIAEELRAGRPVTIPGLVKIRTARKEATAARTMTSPFTGLPMVVKAKPARNVVKVSALKALKTMA